MIGNSSPSVIESPPATVKLSSSSSLAKGNAKGSTTASTANPWFGVKEYAASATAQRRKSNRSIK
ncbi:unnamed protein product [Soboliphyme baturini]|uniref:Uncharacterized protein n=1 Tax=Soboliphyme baturini TaxID=241478 RepID=A0A183IA23_9BILA|nr:unnamed protein product [Soboliphyme baturini]